MLGTGLNMRLERLRNGQFFVYYVLNEANYCQKLSNPNIFYPQNDIKKEQSNESKFIF
jgi:hypothetical protein